MAHRDEMPAKDDWLGVFLSISIPEANSLILVALRGDLLGNGGRPETLASMR